MQGKSSDFSSAASQLKETDLPAALAVIELLKFKGLHQEIPASVDQINGFESKIKSRLENSSVVSFSKTDTCRKKIEAAEIEVADQKLVIPEFYIADIGLAITGVIPTGETGTMFPVIQIDIFSQTEIAEYCLKIDNKEIPTNKIKLAKDGDELNLIFCPDLDANNAISIGTHTTEISVTNAAGEKTERKWSFTVGVYDVSTQPLPPDAVAIKEIIIRPELIGKKAAGQLIAVVYKDKAGRIYTRYRLVKPSGSSIESGNLAFVIREMTSKSNLRSDLVILPGITLALEGHTTTFSYELNGPGDIYSVEWQINGEVTPVPTHTFKSNTRVNCEINATVTVDSDTEFHVVYKATKFIELLTVSTTIYGNRAFNISSQKPFRFDLKSKTIIPTAMDIELAEGESFQLNEENSGVVNADAMLKVTKLHWKIVASEGPVEIKKPVASCTDLIFSDFGRAELVKDIEFILSERGEVQKSSFKPKTSALYAFYPVEGLAKLAKVYPGQLVNTRRSLTFKRIEFNIKGQQRIIQNEAGCNLENPVILCESVLWPASSPLEIKSVLPIIATENPVKDDDSDVGEDDDDDDGDDINSPILEYISRFNFYTRPWPEPCQKQLSCYAMFLPWELPDDSEKSIESDYGISFISPLPPMPVFKAENVLELKLEPSQPQKIPDGMVVEFKAAMTPRPGLGEGVLSDAFSDIAKFDVLDGYKISEFKSVEWLEDATWLSDDDWGSGRIIAKGKYSHIFNPVKGIGSYTMRCRFDFKLKESITDDYCPALPETGVPVEALPDLRILSPINKLVYPLGVSVKVTTTMDKNADLWRQIKWTLNGKPYEHGLQEPPFEIKLDHEGECLIEAQLNIAHPITGLDIPLSSRAKIVVQPLTIAFDPAKKVVKFKQNNGVPLKLMVKAGDFEVKTVKEPFLWHKSGQQAIVDSVEWAFFKEPDDCVSADLNTLDLQKELNFSKPGAATVLATTTVRLADAKNLFKQEHKDFPNDVFEEPVFTFPAVRGDLWAVTISAMRNLEGYFPEKAITGIERTFRVISFDFDFMNKEYSYNSGFGSNTIVLEAAFGNAPVKSTDFSFEWSTKILDENPERNGNTFKFLSEKDGQYQVSLNSYLNFDSNDKVSLGENKYDISSIPIDSLIFGEVDPSSFTINVGKNQKLVCKVWTNDNSKPAVLLPQTLTVLNGAYDLIISNVSWTVNASSSKQVVEAATYDFFGMSPGVKKGAATVHFSILEVIGDQKKNVKEDWQKEFEFIANVNGLEVEILANGLPIIDQDFYQGQKIKLTYKLPSPDKHMDRRGVKWSFDGNLPLSKIETKTDEPSNQNYLLYAYKVLPLKKSDLEQQELEIFLFDYNPDKNAVVGTFSYSIFNEQPREKSFFIPYSKVSVDGFKPENSLDDIQIFEPEPDTWAIGFPFTSSPIGAFEAQAAFKNETSEWYIVGGFQLTRIEAIRSFIDAENNVRKQFLKTINESEAFSNKAEFWLDSYYPAQSSYFNKNILPHDKTTFFQVIQDDPKLPLAKEMSFDGISFQAATFTAEMTFHTFLFAKPNDNDYSYKSFIIPLHVFESSWKTTAFYDAEADKWSKVDGQVHRFKKIDMPILEWKNLAIGKGTGTGIDLSPKWRDLKE